MVRDSGPLSILQAAVIDVRDATILNPGILKRAN